MAGTEADRRPPDGRGHDAGSWGEPTNLTGNRARRSLRMEGRDKASDPLELVA
jgi:hypothetical protein